MNMILFTARLRGRRKRLHDESLGNSSGDSELLNGSTEHHNEVSGLTIYSDTSDPVYNTFSLISGLTLIMIFYTLQKEVEEETIDVIGYEESDKDVRKGQSDKTCEGQTDSDR